MTFTNPSNETLNRREAATYLHTTYHAIAMRDHRNPFDLRPVKIDGKIRYYQKHLDRFAEQQLNR